MQTNLEIASASGRVIGLPVPAQRERRKRAAERRAPPMSLLTVAKEVKRSERLETIVWVGIAIAAVSLLILTFLK